MEEVPIVANVVYKNEIWNYHGSLKRKTAKGKNQKMSAGQQEVLFNVTREQRAGCGGTRQ